MNARKIALWTLVALVLSGTLFAFSVTEDLRRNGGTISFDQAPIGPGTTYTVDETESAATTGIKHIEIQTDSPDLVITASDGGTASVRLHGSVRTTTEASVPHLVMEQKGDTLVFRLERASNLSVGFHNSNLTLDAALPASYAGMLSLSGASSAIEMKEGHFEALSVQTVSGDLSLGALAVDRTMKLQTASGEIQLDEATCGDADISTVSGDKTIGTLTVGGSATFGATSGATEAEQVSARSVVATTVSGDMTLRRLEAEQARLEGASSALRVEDMTGSLKASTVSGDMSFRFSVPGREVAVESTSGAVELEFPGDAGLDVTAQSTSGAVDGSVSLEGGEKKEHRWTGTSGDKSVKVTAKTVSGDIRLD